MRREALALTALLALVRCAGVDENRTATVADSPVPQNSAAALRDRQIDRVGDAARGRAIFATNCATCHGTTGTEGGVGPSLRGEKQRKDLDATIDWIEHPQPPMPAMYPWLLTRDEVADLATYVQSL